MNPEWMMTFCGASEHAKTQFLDDSVTCFHAKPIVFICVVAWLDKSNLLEWMVQVLQGESLNGSLSIASRLAGKEAQSKTWRLFTQQLSAEFRAKQMLTISG